MCFLKKIEFGSPPIFQSCGMPCGIGGTNYVEQNQMIQWQAPDNLNQPYYLAPITQLSTNLMAIVNQIKSNNCIMFGFLNKLNQNQQLLLQADQQLSLNLHLNQKQSTISEALNPHCELNQIPFFASEFITSRIFGRKQFKYKLFLDHIFPTVIYKERNLNIRVKLCNPNQQRLCNVNLIHLCLGVCDDEGKWITEEDGDFFIKGKVETDLYHGEAEFKKIYPKDVSRHFNNGAITIVIYPKKCLINFTGEISNYEKQIDPALIEPLIIKDVIVKAKKKYCSR